MFTDEDAGRYLFHYTTAETFLAHILPSLRLRMSPFAKVNDPRESKIWYWSLKLPPNLEGSWNPVEMGDRFSAKLQRDAKLLCFSRDNPQLSSGRSAHLYGRGYAHPSMSDRYAGRQSGVCLAFEIEKLTNAISKAVDGRGQLYGQPVTYEDMPNSDTDAFALDALRIAEVGEDAAIREHESRFYRGLYFTKSTDWAVEFEYRWVLVASEPDSEHFVDIRSSLTGVIFGDTFPHDAALMVFGHLHQLPGMTFARLAYRNGHPVPMPITG